MYRISLVLTAVLLLGACQTAPHRDAEIAAYGAELSSVGPGEFRLTFRGLTSDSIEQVCDDWQRAARARCAHGFVTVEEPHESVLRGAETRRTSPAVNTSTLDGNTGTAVCQFGGAIACGLLLMMASPGQQTVPVEYPMMAGAIRCKH